MSNHHVYLKSQILSLEQDSSFELELDSAELKHLKVLRVNPGEHLSVIDAAQDYFECEVVSIDAQSCRVRIAQKLHAQPRPYIALAQGLAKGEKMDQIFRHATEVGVSEFIPLSCERSIVKIDPKKMPSKLSRWEGILRSAAQQSGQPKLPTLSTITPFSKLIEKAAHFDCVLVFWEEAPLDASLSLALQELKGRKDARVLVVVGPEGGIRNTEIESLTPLGDKLKIVSLGSSILRTETAGIVAPSLVLYELVGRL